MSVCYNTNIQSNITCPSIPNHVLATEPFIADSHLAGLCMFCAVWSLSPLLTATMTRMLYKRFPSC